MKAIARICGVVTLGCFLPVAAQTTETEEKTTTSTDRAGGTTTETTTTTTFTPEARTKVTQYFDTYKTQPHGLPPTWVTKIKVKEVPMMWKSSRITPGTTIQETQRTFLVEAPDELTELLPSPATGVRYYVAGSNVVAVDPSFRVVDSIQIPSIKFKEKEDR